MGQEQELDDGVLVIKIDHPPVNAIATPVRRQIADALLRAKGDPRIRAVVVTGNGTLFSAGADLGEFAAGTAMDPPSLHGDILPLMASMTKPVVAAVGGTALGGGLELALGCHDRVFAAGTRVGLPETTLGLMPGAGGTQLLPRAIGIVLAADLIVSGRVVPIEDVALPALAHAIVPADRLLGTARRRASELADRPTPFRAIVDQATHDAAGDAHLNALSRDCSLRPDTLPGVVHALEAIALTRSMTIADGMRAEFTLFESLLDSVESRALRHVFLAERRRKPTPDVVRFEQRVVGCIELRLSTESVALVQAGVEQCTIDRVVAGWAARSTAVGISSADDAELEARLLGAMIDEGHDALQAGETEADLDLALVRSGRFARVRGGPFFRAAILGIDRMRWKTNRSEDAERDDG